MATESETLALDRPQEQDKFLALIEKVIANKDVDAEKLKVLVELQIQLEDRQAEQRFNAAMIDARNDVQGIGWDRVNPHTKSNYASYPAIDKKLRPIMEAHGFAVTFGAQPADQPNMMIMYADVMHVAGHTKRYPLPMPIDNKGPQGGTGVMTGPQAVGNGTSYGMRYLVKMIFNIPMLVDKDDNDGNPVRPPISDAEKSNLEKMMKGFSDARKKWLLDQFGISELSALPKSKYNSAIDKINLARKKDESQHGTINADQEATLVALIEGIGGNCKAEFLKTNKIEKVGDLLANQYQGALAALDQLRRK